ncbi:MAG: FAD-dependent oxidoreductase, partial [Planctomycetota bacterium]
MISALEDGSSVWDVIIIGGGATGLGAALEAASRGHRTLLLESHDFAKGTSSRSTKLIHGGVRYLRQGQIGMVRQSLLERQRLFRNAPHLVHPLEFILPTYRFGKREFFYAGLRLYDMLAGQFWSERARCLTSRSVARDLPGVRQEGLRGGVRYMDGQFDDSRLAITLARTAAQHGAIVLNYMKVDRLLCDNGRVRGVIARDEYYDREYRLAGRSVINATGVFAEHMLGQEQQCIAASE